MLLKELPPIPTSPRPSIPPASPRTIPSIPNELPKIPSEFPKLVDPESKIGRVVERVRLYSDPVDGVDSRASSRRCALRQEPEEDIVQDASALMDAGAKTHKSPKHTKTKRKRKAKRKPQEDSARVSVLEALHPQSQKPNPILHRAAVDDGLQKAERYMSEMASQRLAVARKASEEQRARVRARAIKRQQRQPQKIEHVTETETTKDDPVPIESDSSPKAVANRRAYVKQPSDNKEGENEVRPRFNSEASMIADCSILSVIKPSRDKTERMTDLHKRAALFKKECARRSRLLKRQLSYDALPEIEQQLYQRVYARAHADMQHLSCRLAEVGLIGKDDEEIEAIKASCSNFLGQNHDDNIISFALDLVPSVRKQLREGQRETFLDLFASADRSGLSPGLTEDVCLDIMTNLYVGVVSSSDLDMLKKELSNAFRLAMDRDTARIYAEDFVNLFWHLRETYDREHAERERRIIEKYGIDIDSDDARAVKDDLLSLHELLASKSDNEEERRLDIVDVRGIVGIFIESGLLPYGGDQSAVTERWFKEMSEKKEIGFQDLRRLVEKIREESWQRERQHVERIFEEFDKNRTGSLNIVQISAFLKSLGLLPRSKSDQDELKRLLDEVDVDSSGALDFDEFSRLVQKVTIRLRAAQRRRENEVSKQLDFTQHQLSELREAYFTLDVNKNHLLEINECRKALTLMRNDMSGPALNEIFGVLDRDHDARINFEEFLFFVKAVEKQDWRPFIEEKFLARGDGSMMDNGRHLFAEDAK